MIWVSDHFQKLRIPPGAAHVLRRAGARSVQAGRVVLPSRGFQDVFDQDSMLPIIAKIVQIPELKTFARDNLFELVIFLRSDFAFFPIVLKQGSVILAGDVELVQVRVRPSHSDLEDEM